VLTAPALGSQIITGFSMRDINQVARRGCQASIVATLHASSFALAPPFLARLRVVDRLISMNTALIQDEN
jgi:hypothetical protein